MNGSNIGLEGISFCLETGLPLQEAQAKPRCRLPPEILLQSAGEQAIVYIKESDTTCFHASCPVSPRRNGRNTFLSLQTDGLGCVLAKNRNTWENTGEHRRIAIS